jgi:hypothetical protein
VENKPAIDKQIGVVVLQICASPPEKSGTQFQCRISAQTFSSDALRQYMHNPLLSGSLSRSGAAVQHLPVTLAILSR